MPLSHSQIWTAIDALAARGGLTASGLARRAGLDPTAFNRSKRFGPGDPPRPRWPSTESLHQVLAATGVSLADFAALAGDAPPLRVPMLGLAQAGADGFFDASGFPVGDAWDEAELPAPNGATFALTIQGDSMTPLYRPGDRVIVDRSDARVARGDRVVVQTRAGEVMAKEIAAMNARSVTLASINPDHPPRTLARKDIAWISRIQWVSQ